MTLADTIESCAQDHGLSPRTAALIAERVTDRLAEEAGQGDVVAAAVLRCSTEEAVRAAEEERAELLAALEAVEWSGYALTEHDSQAPACPFCSAFARRGEHYSECLVGDAIARARGAAAEAQHG